jgi:putative FmdB family regulatory protein
MMPQYVYFCWRCDKDVEVIKPMKDTGIVEFCPTCQDRMERNFQAEGVFVGAGRRSYHKPIVSDSLAINPEQIPEHKKRFPDIKVTSEGQPVFDNFSDHEKYLKKCNVEKMPQKRKRKGRRIA